MATRWMSETARLWAGAPTWRGRRMHPDVREEKLPFGCQTQPRFQILFSHLNWKKSVKLIPTQVWGLSGISGFYEGRKKISMVSKEK